MLKDIEVHLSLSLGLSLNRRPEKLNRGGIRRGSGYDLSHNGCIIALGAQL
jgi:hypothetical protein